MLIPFTNLIFIFQKTYISKKKVEPKYDSTFFCFVKEIIF
jgi:hypothetical protein